MQYGERNSFRSFVVGVKPNSHSQHRHYYTFYSVHKFSRFRLRSKLGGGPMCLLLPSSHTTAPVPSQGNLIAQSCPPPGPIAEFPVADGRILASEFTTRPQQPPRRRTIYQHNRRSFIACTGEGRRPACDSGYLHSFALWFKTCDFD